VLDYQKCEHSFASIYFRRQCKCFEEERFYKIASGGGHHLRELKIVLKSDVDGFLTFLTESPFSKKMVPGFQQTNILEATTAVIT
jgi:hypothetical protein